MDEIHAVDVVPGEIVVVERGDVITADIRLVDASKLQVDESALTGESAPVGNRVAPLEKRLDRLGHRLTTSVALRNGLLVYVGNFTGALSVAFAMLIAGTYESGGDVFGAAALDVAAGDLASDWAGILAVIFPISAFAAGFEHSIANMYFVPVGPSGRHLRRRVHRYARTRGSARGAELGRISPG